MISPSDLVKRVGVGGRLVPFFKCAAVYLVAGAGGAPSSLRAGAKCAPVLCLLLLVLLTHRSRYARRVAAGLALSALGDALLVWPALLEWGMCAFLCAHVAYALAFGWAPPRRALGAALYAAAALFVWRLGRPAGAARALLATYAAALATTAWRGLARGGAAAAGAVLFLLSDALLGCCLFGDEDPLPHSQLLVMCTYYLAQLGIALSALQPPAPAAAAAAAAAVPHAS